MLGKLILVAATSASALVMLPAAAQAGKPYPISGAQYRGGYNDGYYRDGYRRYRPGDYYAGRGYGYNNGYYRGRRCGGDGTTGAIVGGAAGALVGHEIGRSGNHYHRGYGYGYGRYGHGGGGTTGAIIGGAIGALIGHEVARNSC